MSMSLSLGWNEDDDDDDFDLDASTTSRSQQSKQSESPGPYNNAFDGTNTKADVNSSFDNSDTTSTRKTPSWARSPATGASVPLEVKRPTNDDDHDDDTREEETYRLDISAADGDPLESSSFSRTSRQQQQQQAAGTAAPNLSISESNLLGAPLGAMFRKSSSNSKFSTTSSSAYGLQSHHDSDISRNASFLTENTDDTTESDSNNPLSTGELLSASGGNNNKNETSTTKMDYEPSASPSQRREQLDISDSEAPSHMSNSRDALIDDANDFLDGFSYDLGGTLLDDTTSLSESPKPAALETSSSSAAKARRKSRSTSFSSQRRASRRKSAGALSISSHSGRRRSRATPTTGTASTTNGSPKSPAVTKQWNDDDEDGDNETTNDDNEDDNLFDEEDYDDYDLNLDDEDDGDGGNFDDEEDNDDYFGNASGNANDVDDDEEEYDEETRRILAEEDEKDDFADILGGFDDVRLSPQLHLGEENSPQEDALENGDVESSSDGSPNIPRQKDERNDDDADLAGYRYDTSFGESAESTSPNAFAFESQSQAAYDTMSLGLNDSTSTSSQQNIDSSSVEKKEGSETRNGYRFAASETPQEFDTTRTYEGGVSLTTPAGDDDHQPHPPADTMEASGKSLELMDLGLDSSQSTSTRLNSSSSGKKQDDVQESSGSLFSSPRSAGAEESNLITISKPTPAVNRRLSNSGSMHLAGGSSSMMLPSTTSALSFTPRYGANSGTPQEMVGSDNTTLAIQRKVSFSDVSSTSGSPHMRRRRRSSNNAFKSSTDDEEIAGGPPSNPKSSTFVFRRRRSSNASNSAEGSPRGAAEPSDNNRRYSNISHVSGGSVDDGQEEEPRDIASSTNSSAVHDALEKRQSSGGTAESPSGMHNRNKPPTPLMSLVSSDSFQQTPQQSVASPLRNRTSTLPPRAPSTQQHQKGGKPPPSPSVSFNNQASAGSTSYGSPRWNNVTAFGDTSFGANTGNSFSPTSYQRTDRSSSFGAGSPFSASRSGAEGRSQRSDSIAMMWDDADDEGNVLPPPAATGATSPSTASQKSGKGRGRRCSSVMFFSPDSPVSSMSRSGRRGSSVLGSPDETVRKRSILRRRSSFGTGAITSIPKVLKQIGTGRHKGKVLQMQDSDLWKRDLEKAADIRVRELQKREQRMFNAIMGTLAMEELSSLPLEGRRKSTQQKQVILDAERKSRADILLNGCFSEHLQSILQPFLHGVLRLKEQAAFDTIMDEEKQQRWALEVKLKASRPPKGVATRPTVPWSTSMSPARAQQLKRASAANWLGASVASSPYPSRPGTAATQGPESPVTGVPPSAVNNSNTFGTFTNSSIFSGADLGASSLAQSIPPPAAPPKRPPSGLTRRAGNGGGLSDARRATGRFPPPFSRPQLAQRDTKAATTSSAGASPTYASAPMAFLPSTSNSSGVGVPGGVQPNGVTLRANSTGAVSSSCGVRPPSTSSIRSTSTNGSTLRLSALVGRFDAVFGRGVPDGLPTARGPGRGTDAPLPPLTARF